MYSLVRAHPRFGYRRITGRLRSLGFLVNPKRVYRLWKQEGFKVPRKRKKKEFKGSSRNGITQRQAKGPNDIWAWDFIFDRDCHGRSLKWLTMVDEFTRECLILEVGRSLPSTRVVEHLRKVIAERGVPNAIRSDNGPEFIADHVESFMKLIDSESAFIEPGSPWENGFAESFHSRMRDEFLNRGIFIDKEHAQAESRRWKEHYNLDRPHSSLGNLPPAEFAAIHGSRVPTDAPQNDLQLEPILA